MTMGQTFPPPVDPDDLTLANPDAGKPRAVPADFTGGAKGDDVDVSTAAVTNVTQNNTAVPNYAPRTQAQKAADTGNTLAVDVARARGWIAPQQPYGAVPAAPVVVSIDPATAPASHLPLTVTITGTGFTEWSTVYTGGQTTPDVSAEYISPTTMKVAIYAAAPGNVSVAVEDHNVLSNTDVVFVVT